MVLDVESPAPPDLTNRGVPDEFEAVDAIGSESDFRRAELEEMLRDGAWNEAFLEWAEYTDLTETEFRTVRDHGLFEQLDVYWDPVEERLRFTVPAPPETLADEGDLASRVTAELADLGQTVVEMLEDAYLDWGDRETSETAWSEEKASEELTGEE